MWGACILSTVFKNHNRIFLQFQESRADVEFVGREGLTGDGMRRTGIKMVGKGLTERWREGKRVNHKQAIEEGCEIVSPVVEEKHTLQRGRTKHQGMTEQALNCCLS